VLYGNDGDNENELRYFRLAAEKGDVKAQCSLALTLENVLDKKAPQNEESFKWMKAAADQGHIHANYMLGNFYRDGTWVEVDYPKAFECYTKAAERGDVDAFDRLGECYAFGLGTPKDEHLAFQYFRSAAEWGNPKGQCNLAKCYLEGRGCHQDTGLAFQWLSRAIDSDSPLVAQILQNWGLDVAKLSRNYKQLRRIQSAMTGDHFGAMFDQVCSSPSGAKPL
jgi:TPR repeat protein